MSNVALLALVAVAFTWLALGPVIITALGVPHEMQWGVFMAGTLVLVLLWTLVFSILEDWP